MSPGRVNKPGTVFHGERLFKIWWYRGWSAMCRDCQVGIAHDAPSWAAACARVQTHWIEHHAPLELTMTSAGAIVVQVAQPKPSISPKAAEAQLAVYAAGLVWDPSGGQQ